MNHYLIYIHILQNTIMSDKAVDSLSKLNNAEKVLYTNALLSGLVIGYGIGTANLFGLFTWRLWKNRYTNVKRYLYNLKTKTHYITGDITSETVDAFKKFMLTVKSDETVDVIIDTNGGTFSGAQMMSDMLLSHEGVTNAIVLNKAFSAGTLIALSCRNLYMHKNAHLSPVDVQQGNFFDVVQLSAVKNIIEKKTADKINDNTFLLADQAEKCKSLMNTLFEKIIKPQYVNEISMNIKKELFDGEKYIHSTTFSFNDLKKMGLNVQIITPNMIAKANLELNEPAMLRFL